MNVGGRDPARKRGKTICPRHQRVISTKFVVFNAGISAVNDVCACMTMAVMAPSCANVTIKPRTIADSNGLRVEFMRFQTGRGALLHPNETNKK
jgi:hypothetical protein